MTKRRNRWSQEEEDGLIQEVDNRVFQASGSLTVHSVIYGEGFASSHNAKYHEGLPVRTSSSLQTKYFRHQADNKELLSAMLGNGNSDGSNNMEENWDQMSTQEATGRDSGSSEGGTVATVATCTAPEDVDWSYYPMSFYMMHCVVRSMVRVEICVNENGAEWSPPPPKGPLSKCSAMLRRMRARWPASFPPLLRELSAAQLAHLVEPWRSTMEDFSKDVPTELGPDICATIFQPLADMGSRSSPRTVGSIASSSSSSNYATANLMDHSGSGGGNEHNGAYHELGNEEWSWWRWVKDGPLLEGFKPSWPDGAFPPLTNGGPSLFLGRSES